MQTPKQQPPTTPQHPAHIELQCDAQRLAREPLKQATGANVVSVECPNACVGLGSSAVDLVSASATVSGTLISVLRLLLVLVQISPVAAGNKTSRRQKRAQQQRAQQQQPQAQPLA